MPVFPAGPSRPTIKYDVRVKETSSRTGVPPAGRSNAAGVKSRPKIVVGVVPAAGAITKMLGARPKVMTEGARHTVGARPKVNSEGARSTVQAKGKRGRSDNFQPTSQKKFAVKEPPKSRPVPNTSRRSAPAAGFALTKLKKAESPKRSILKKIEESAKKSDNAENTKHVKFRSKTTDQESLRSKLKEWLKSKNRTPSRCCHLINYDAEMSAKKKETKLADRRITSNLLTGQAKVMDQEVRKSLFKSEIESKSKIEKSKQNVTLRKHSDIDTLLDDTIEFKENFKEDSVVVSESDESEERSSIRPQTTCPDTAEPGEEEMAGILARLTNMLEECHTLFQSGCPRENLLPWLEKMEEEIPQATKSSQYYITKARLLYNQPAEMLHVFCQAVKNQAQPSDLLAAEMQNLLGKAFTRTAPMILPMQNDALPEMSTSKIADSRDKTPEKGSTVRYSIYPAPPLLCDQFFPSTSKTPEPTNVSVITPVRRSLRLSNRPSTPANKPAMAHRDNTPGSRNVAESQSTPGAMTREVNSTSDLTQAEMSKMLFKDNEAITGDS